MRGYRTRTEGKMHDMRYEAPKTLKAAVGLLAGAGGQARVLAGGTDLLIQMRGGRVEPVLVVDIKRIPEMTSITLKDGAYRFGAAVPCMALVENKRFGKTWPGVVDGANLIGSIQVRGRATVGGNLCNASPAADTVPAMIAAGAVASIAGPAGRRDVPIEDVATGPGKTSLAADEIVASFLLPRRPPRSGDAYLRFIPRTEMDIAVVGAGVNLTLDATGVCTQARVAIGAVAERALLVPDAAAALVGTEVDEAALQRMAAAVSAACRPIDDKRGTKEYRIKVSGVMARRAAQIALERAKRSN
jgi:carbon-monoxide dehydrogenase medium subunit